LALDAVEAAASGHVGLPLGMADAALALFRDHLKFDPADPAWPDRDRFILSGGHGSMLLYGLLHLTGYPAPTLADIKAFRQLNSPCAGHPESAHLQGVETTTGPLGQGFANAVGFALAERLLAARFGAELVDHYTYVLASDGDLMEGVSQEALSLAGHLQLNRLIVLWDDNDISIDGKLGLADRTDQLARFAASGWAVERVDGHDVDAVSAAIARAKTSDRPSLIACKTIIGFGAPTLAGTAKAHGGPYGAAEVAGAKAALGWEVGPFEVPEDARAGWRAIGARGAGARAAWAARLGASAQASAFTLAVSGQAPEGLDAAILAAKEALVASPKAIATRAASGHALDVITALWPEMLGGSADLTGSNNTKAKGMEPVTAPSYAGRYMHWGIREHAMASAMNGLALHGGVIPYSGTFLVFSDYARPAIRLAALMGQRVIFVMTHDSIGVGEDGPTHQPVEHVAALRAIPGLAVFRPADAVETLEAWQAMLARTDGPSLIVLTRQNLAPARTVAGAENLTARGAYVLAPAVAPERVALLATGSEVEIALAAKATLEARGIGARVVSMPCWSAFEALDRASQDAVLGPEGLLRVGIEAGVRMGWDRWIGRDGVFIGMDGFGASAPYKVLYQHFGLTADRVVAEVTARVG
jgi:transketolase